MNIYMFNILCAIILFIIAITLIFGNMKESSIVMYEQNGVVVSFDVCILFSKESK